MNRTRTTGRDLIRRFQSCCIAATICLVILMAAPAIAQQIVKGTVQHRRALIVGISKYQRNGSPNERCDLNTDRDIEALREVLVRKFGFKAEDVKVLHTQAETTRSAILSTFHTFLIDQTEPGDTVYFHFSGHGSQVPDKDGDEVDDGKDETIVPSDYVSETDGSKDITDDEIGTLLDQLKAKHPGSITASFDCCYSGTNTRGDSSPSRGSGCTTAGPIKSGNKSRGTREVTGGPFECDGELSGAFAVMSACAHDQEAKETRDDEGRDIGLFTYCLSKALNQAGPQTTYRDVVEQVNDFIAQIRDDQNPQFEGDADKALFGLTDIPPVQPYYEAHVDGSTVALQAGELDGVTKGSVYALYPAGTKDPKSAVALGDASVASVDFAAAGLQPTVQCAGKLSAMKLTSVRAFEKRHSYGDNALRVDCSALASIPEGQKIADQVTRLPLVAAVSRGGKVKIDVKVLPEIAASSNGPALPTGNILVERWDNARLCLVSGQNPVAEIQRVLEAESRSKFIRSLTNRDPFSRVKIEMRVVPVNYEADAQGKTKRVLGDKALPKTRGVQQSFHPDDRVVVEIRNTGRADAWVTLLDLQPDGMVKSLYPKAKSRIPYHSFPPDGKWHRIEDLVVRITEPAGLETLKSIATPEQRNFSVLCSTGAARGSSAEIDQALQDPLGRLLDAAVQGKQTRGEDDSPAPADWATASVNYRVVPSAQSGQQ